MHVCILDFFYLDNNTCCCLASYLFNNVTLFACCSNSVVSVVGVGLHSLFTMELTNSVLVLHCSRSSASYCIMVGGPLSTAVTRSITTFQHLPKFSEYFQKALTICLFVKCIVL